MKKNNNPSWLAEFKQEKIPVEPFHEEKQETEYVAIIKEVRGQFKKIAYALRLDNDINEILEKQTIGSKNAVINALLRYAINDIKEKKIILK